MAARIAAEQAISSQLLDITIDGARGILLNVTGGPDLTLFEVNQAAAIIRETSHPDVNMIFGAVIDPNMGDEIRITVIATGSRVLSRSYMLSMTLVAGIAIPRRIRKGMMVQMISALVLWTMLVSATAPVDLRYLTSE